MRYTIMVTIVAWFMLWACLNQRSEPHADLLLAMEWVESRCDTTAIGDNGQAIGVLQIHPVMVDECNRILGREEFHLDDRWSRQKSRRMFQVYTAHYSTGESDEVIARRWNGGPTGDNKDATEEYWQKVKKCLDKAER